MGRRLLAEWVSLLEVDYCYYSSKMYIHVYYCHAISDKTSLLSFKLETSALSQTFCLTKVLLELETCPQRNALSDTHGQGLLEIWSLRGQSQHAQCCSVMWSQDMVPQRLSLLDMMSETLSLGDSISDRFEIA